VLDFFADAHNVDVRAHDGPRLVAHAEHQAQRGILQRDVHVGDARGVVSLHGRQLREGDVAREHGDADFVEVAVHAQHRLRDVDAGQGVLHDRQDIFHDRGVRGAALLQQVLCDARALAAVEHVPQAHRLREPLAKIHGLHCL